jgi:hypothetical protein
MQKGKGKRRKDNKGLGCRSVVQCLPSIYKALCLIPTPQKKDYRGSEYYQSTLYA